MTCSTVDGWAFMGDRREKREFQNQAVLSQFARGFGPSLIFRWHYVRICWHSAWYRACKSEGACHHFAVAPKNRLTYRVHLFNVQYIHAFGGHTTTYCHTRVVSENFERNPFLADAKMRVKLAQTLKSDSYPNYRNLVDCLYLSTCHEAGGPIHKQGACVNHCWYSSLRVCTMKQKEWHFRKHMSCTHRHWVLRYCENVENSKRQKRFCIIDKTLKISKNRKTTTNIWKMKRDNVEWWAAFLRLRDLSRVGQTSHSPTKVICHNYCLRFENKKD